MNSTIIAERKRKRTDSLDDQPIRKWWHIVLESEPEVPSEEDSESVWSVQEKETDFAKDTSDTCTKSEISSASERELSPLTLSDPSDVGGSTDTSSASDKAVIVIGRDVVVMCEENLSWADDSSNSDSRNPFHHDSEVPKADYWQCARCHCKNNNPLFRYCEKCFKFRKSEVPQRPQRKNRKKRLKSCSMSKARRLPFASQHVSAKPNEAGSSQESLPDGSSSLSQESGLSDLAASQRIIGLCQICEVEPQNAGFLHLKLVHVWGCYRCSKEVWWRQKKRCPVCNCQSSRVVKVFF